MRIHYFHSCLLLCAVILTISGCDSRTHTPAKISSPLGQNPTKERPVGPTGQVIDPSKKKVIVVSAPRQSENKDEHLSALKTEHAKKGKQLTTLIGSYSKNIDNTEEKDKIASEMAKNLAVYKRQSLELYKAQQLSPKTGQAN